MLCGLGKGSALACSSSKQTHHYAVVPTSVRSRHVAFPPFNDEATSFISPARVRYRRGL